MIDTPHEWTLPREYDDWKRPGPERNSDPGKIAPPKNGDQVPNDPKLTGNNPTETDKRCFEERHDFSQPASPDWRRPGPDRDVNIRRKGNALGAGFRRLTGAEAQRLEGGMASAIVRGQR